MTLAELIVFNSTIPAGGGTTLDHLKSVRTTRATHCGLIVEVSSAIITVNIKTPDK